MDRSQFTDISSFTIQGRLLRLYGKHPNKPKGVQVKTETGKHRIRLAKTLRKQGCPGLVMGEWVWITGFIKSRSGQIILKALEIRAITPEASLCNSMASSDGQVNASSTQLRTILICKKSSCVKKGAKAVEQAIADVMCDRLLTNKIKIKSTKCMGDCKNGPHLIFLPGSQRYQNVTPDDASNLI